MQLQCCGGVHECFVIQKSVGKWTKRRVVLPAILCLAYKLKEPDAGSWTQPCLETAADLPLGEFGNSHPSNTAVTNTDSAWLSSPWLCKGDPSVPWVIKKEKFLQPYFLTSEFVLITVIMVHSQLSALQRKGGLWHCRMTI